MHRDATQSVLIVEDVSPLAESYAAYLRALGARIEIALCGSDALQAIEDGAPDVIVLDVNLPDMSGIDVLKRLREKGNAAQVIVITGEGSIRIAVEAMRNGARDFLVKPFTIDRLRQAVSLALSEASASAGEAPQEPGGEFPGGAEGVPGFIGRSERMRSVYRLLKSAAPSSATVFLSGESGTGKEVCAHAFHRLSKRRDGPFVVINCAAIPRDLLESEIFGHVKGAFTGAVADRKGAALQANGGTLFLDEICEMDIGLQAKLLRFLQDRQVRRLGEDVPRPTDVRIVCATNRDPHAEAAAGRFREDLLYRLHVVPIEMPPLRERGDDVVLIAREVLTRFAREDGKQLTRFSPEAEAALLAYRWPGNVRQLQNVIRSVVVLNDGQVVTRDMLPAFLVIEAVAGSVPEVSRREDPRPVIRPLEVVIRETIEQAIEHCGGSIPKAAAALTVSPSTLYRRIQAWDGANPQG